MGELQTRRNTALDAARGLSVFAMIAVHLLPYEVADDAGAIARAGAQFNARLFDKPAPVFCMVAGMAIVLSRTTAKALLARAAVLFAFGALFRAFVFPTEILSPLALMMLIGFAAWRLGTAAQWLGAAAILVAVPCFHAAFGELAAADWTEDNDHLADFAFGWVTLRYYAIDGNYALIPWTLFVIVGLLWAQANLESRFRAATITLASIPILVGGELYRTWSDEAWENHELADAYAVIWDPMATLPFVAICLSTALAVIGTFLWLGPNPVSRFLALLGRASLTHYVLHIVAVFVPLRCVYPEEDWSMPIGAAGFAAYLTFAIPATVVWFRSFDRGPLEGLWAGARWRRG